MFLGLPGDPKPPRHYLLATHNYKRPNGNLAGDNSRANGRSVGEILEVLWIAISVMR